MPDLTVAQAKEQFGVKVVEYPYTRYEVLGFNVTPVDSPSVILFQVLDQGGQPKAGVQVRMGWPGESKVSFPSNAEGMCDVGAGGDSWYDPEAGAAGPYYAVVEENDSDFVQGLGWFDGTNHQHLMTVFQEREGSTPEPPPDPGPTRYVDHAEGEISEARFHELMGDVEIDRGEGERVYRLTDVYVEQKPKEERHMEVMVLDSDGLPLDGVPVKWFSEEAVLHEEATVQGLARYLLPREVRYSVPGHGPMMVRINKECGIRCDVFRGCGQVIVGGQPNRHANLVYHLLEEKPPGQVPDPPQGLRVTNVTQSSIELVWYAQDGAVYQVNGPHGEVVVYEPEYIAYGLEGATAYTIQVRAGNEHGWSAWVGASAVTLPGTPDNIEAKIDSLTALVMAMDLKLDVMLGNQARLEGEFEEMAGTLDRGFDTTYGKIDNHGNDVGRQFAELGAKAAALRGEMEQAVEELKRIEGSCTCQT